jgi:hypothetical protein
MPDLICPFSVPLIKQDFNCKYAREIIRRGGSEIACEQADQHSMCCKLHTVIKNLALAVMGYEDDLLSVPHNVLVKIQYGGLLGLEELLNGKRVEDDKVADIATVVNRAHAEYQNFDSIPEDPINNAILNYKTQRRGRK